MVTQSANTDDAVGFPSAPPGTAAANFFASLKATGVGYAGARGDGGTFYCPNPHHEDEHPSLDVTVKPSGKVVFTCTPCRQAMGQDAYVGLLRGVGVKWSGSATDPESVQWGEPCTVPAKPSVENRKTGTKGEVRLTAVHHYRFADGTDNFKVRRFDPVEGSTARKFFAPMRWEHGWVGKAGALDGVERTPYNLERFAEWAEAGLPLYLVEGEKAADALVAAGKAATTFHGGADGKVEPGWPTRYGFDRFREVRLWPDADEAGVNLMRARAEELEAAGVKVAFWGLAEGEVEPKDDAFDVLARGQQPRSLFDLHLDALAALKPLPRAPGKPALSLVIGGKALVPAEPWNGGDSADSEPEAGPFPVSLAVKPYVFAEEYVERFHTSDDAVLTLRSEVGGINYVYEAGRGLYVPIEPEVLESHLVANLRDAQEVAGDGEVRDVNLKPAGVNALLRGIDAYTLMGGANPRAAARLVNRGIPFRNGWLNVETGKFVREVSPEWFTTWRVPYDYDDRPWDASQTPAWMEFLGSLGFTEETGGKYGAQAYRLLRQIMALPFYYGRVSKAPLLIGESRSGKGTILGLMEEMVGGDVGAAATDIDSLSSEFALEDFLGKRLVTIGDARFGQNLRGRTKTRILSLTGGDALPVNRKNKKSVTKKLDLRLVIATNETPKFIEASNALAERFALLHFNTSFLGREDDNLIARVRAELPGIVRWVLGGLADLQKTGRLAETDRGREAVTEMTEHGSQVRGFVADRCVLDRSAWVSSSDLRQAYLAWQEDEGEFRLSSKKFGIDLVDAFRGEGVEQRNTSKARGYQGLRLLPGWETR